MKVSTRDRIMRKSVELFNLHGFAAVTLFQIAGELSMTRGNLTYHFKDKDILLDAIAEELWSKLEVEKNKTRLLPSFENMHNELQLFYRFQKEYRFIFMDHHVLNHPSMRIKFQNWISTSIKETKATIAFAISAGNMQPEPYKGIYHNLAVNTWLVSYYWLNHQIITEKINNTDTNVEGEMKVWSLLLPHLTEKGLRAFRNFFGKEYLKNMGKSFNADIGTYVRF